MSKNPSTRQKLFAEVEAVLAGRTVAYEDIAKLSFTRRVINEALRLHPPLWAVSRVATADDEVGGYRVAKGCMVMVLPWLTHRLADLWPNPEAFDPERFSEVESNKRHKFSYLPFWVGQHKCIAEPLSLFQLTAIIVTITQRFQLDLEGGFEPRADAEVGLNFKDGLRMVATNRLRS